MVLKYLEKEKQIQNSENKNFTFFKWDEVDCYMIFFNEVKFKVFTVFH